ncbi:transglycosylase domain-containing protein [Halobacillus sp. Marseille-Q1614]|uniref:transglycosylase domain-containing protein n=1 Tax=Halobacillus sp. Marseille-Q1614 TaxID=2709134 RepID=UPI0015713D52|nr:transglycosylase domain-containing protein [Halobacillus sp. Marseille-Q1614]
MSKKPNNKINWKAIKAKTTTLWGETLRKSRSLWERSRPLVKSLWGKTQSLWGNGTIQKNFRIGYDVVWNVILFFILIGIIGLFFAGGVGAGYFASLVKDQPAQSPEEIQSEIYNYEETSQVYFAGEELLGEVRTDLYRDEISLDQVDKNLKNAVIATEDEYFETHDGVVPKAVLRAIVQEATNSAVKTGGSTLTQQVVKNQILTNEVSFERKAKEILIAMRIEKFFEKEEILEAYLNIVPFGRNANGDNIAGVKTAAEGIFGVGPDELSIAQAAFIAGLPQNPFSYTPFLNNGEVKSDENLQAGIERMHEVLSRMYSAGYISKEEYDKAMKFDLKENLREPSSRAREKYPFLVTEANKRAKDKMVAYLAEKNGDSLKDIRGDEELKAEYETLAERELSSGGYKIHTTIDKEVYEVMQKIKDNYTNYDSTRTVTVEEEGETVTKEMPVEVGSTLIENSTGKILGFIGGRDHNREQVNHATQARRSPGSTMKPLTAYGPGIDMGEIHPGSVFTDVPYQYPGTDTDVGNYGGGYNGFVSAREALKRSLNIPAVKSYTSILDKNPGEYLSKMGFSTIPEEAYQYPSLALGSAEVINEEMTNAYAAFGNMGNFVDAYMIEKIETKEGEVIYEHEAKDTEVFSPQASYLTIDMMRDVLSSGTASGLKGQLTHPGVDWAGKTGTSQDYKDAWFIATNPNVTMSMWMGYDYNERLNRNGYSSRNTGLWARVVNAVTEIRPELMAPSASFERPGGIESKSYCATSGLLASDLCSSAGLSRSDLYISKFAPTKKDDSLTSGDFVEIKGDLYPAGSDTPGEFIINEGGGVTLSPEFIEENNYDSPEILKHLIPDDWDNVAISSSGSSGGGTVENDNSNPSAPGNVSTGSSRLSWSHSSSDDVVGYRIYRAGTSGGSFSQVGSTRGTSFSLEGDGVYAVRAVDYFGQSSGLSSTVEVGNTEPSNENSGSNNSDSNNNDSESEENGESSSSDTSSEGEESEGDSSAEDEQSEENSEEANTTSEDQNEETESEEESSEDTSNEDSADPEESENTQ